MGGWYGGMMGGWGAMLGMGLLWIVLLAVIIWAVVRLLPDRRTGTGAPDSTPHETPEQILDRRFARGEIDLETYRTQRDVLAQARKDDRR